MMKIRDWNDSLRYAKGFVQKLKTYGLDMRVQPYSMYDGAKGLHSGMCHIG